MIFWFRTLFRFGIKTSFAGFPLLILCISLRQRFVLLVEHTYKTYWAFSEYIVLIFFYCEVYNLPKREYIQFVVKNSWKISCTLPYSPASSEPEHLLHSLKPLSFLSLLKITSILISILIIPLLLFLCLPVSLYCWTCLLKIIFMWMESCYFSLSCCFCLSFLSLKCAGAFNWHTSCFLLCAVLWCEYAMIYLSIFLLVRIWLF